jgi:hypothetical protein
VVAIARARIARLPAAHQTSLAGRLPYIGGEEVNTSPTQAFNRYVINFGDMTLEQAGGWPDLFEIVRTKVKPERDSASHSTAKWWHFERLRPELYAAATKLQHCLICSRHSKHLIIAIQPIDRVFSEGTNVFTMDSYTAAGVLQSRPHNAFARLVSSSLEDRLRYSVTDCFETFPFPHPDPRVVIPQLEQAGQTLYEARTAYMLETQQGLTQTYNRLKDPACADPAIQHLRTLHEELDRAVLAAYGWSDIPVPPYTTPQTPTETTALQLFEDTLIDRLFLLNVTRADKTAASFGRSTSIPLTKAPKSPT